MGKKYSQLSPAEQRYVFTKAGKISVDIMAKTLNCKPERIKGWAYKHGLSLKVNRK
ncbi:hypothetical protein CB3_069 [Pectobacterium phage vB_PatP_CB3]|uniref:Uncharacterized protein n=2 Tax=Cbunavirus TaxID=2842586 RepID=A0A2P0PAR6_9CAUD|nr:hypothetical protein HWB08_gp64 [Pectobacterium phage vB_PatP_CB1]ARB11791.1 hypothetical protein CB1_64 [Pectobacterium phage vB_PatP_CB1]ARB11893.1 hypothetical protein CB3_069 [Pectobacterium phage vB_PatP_CB3]